MKDISHYFRLFEIVANYTSKYFKLARLPNVSWDTVTTHMTSIFAQHGIPKVVFKDIETQWNSYDFNKCSKSLHFRNSTASLEFPKNNEFEKRTIQTIKKTLQKCREDDSEP